MVADEARLEKYLQKESVDESRGHLVQVKWAVFLGMPVGPSVCSHT